MGLNTTALTSRVSSFGDSFIQFVPPPDGITFNFDQGLARNKTDEIDNELNTRAEIIRK
jgi:hypothetical protein